MTGNASTLFEAFREDHAALGRGLHELAQWLRADNPGRAAECASRIDETAGPHIAFEEEHFYPALRRILGDADVEQMYRGHEKGLDILHAVMALPAHQPIDARTRQRLLAGTAAMERHVADCGELFEAMGRIPRDEQESLRRELFEWRRRAPRWTSYTGSRRQDAAAQRASSSH